MGVECQKGHERHAGGKRRRKRTDRAFFQVYRERGAHTPTVHSAASTADTPTRNPA